MDILQGIGNLLLSQGTLAPVGEGVGFSELDADHAMDKLGVAYLCPITNHRRCHLRVEYRRRDLADNRVQQFKVLLAAMDDLFNVEIRKHCPKTVQRTDGWDINDSGQALHRDLDKLQTGHETILTHELRIQRKMLALAKVTAEVCQSVGIGDVVDVRMVHCAVNWGDWK